MEKKDIRSMTREELIEDFAQFDEPKFRAEQVFKWISSGIEDFSKIVKLIQDTDLSNERKVKKLVKKVSKIAPKGCSQWQALIQGEHEFLVKNKK